MLDIADFVHGPTPEKIAENQERLRENQRRRGAPVEAVDEVVALFKVAREGKKGLYLTTHHWKMDDAQ